MYAYILGRFRQKIRLESGKWKLDVKRENGIDSDDYCKGVEV